MHPDDAYKIPAGKLYTYLSDGHNYQNLLDNLLDGPFAGPKNKPRFLFLGGPEDGNFVKTYGDKYWKVVEHPSDKALKYDSSAVPTIKVQLTVYEKRSIWIPGNEKVWVYFPQSTTPVMQEDLLCSWLMAHMGPQPEQSKKYSVGNFGGVTATNGANANLAVATKKAEPRKDGLQITIGGHTIAWEDLDTNQVAGLMQWAAQSLGPGQDLKS